MNNSVTVPVTLLTVKRIKSPATRVLFCKVPADAIEVVVV